ncbi:MAG: hypothetical protein ACE1ZS_11860 [Candidatus Poribacteria bacterium]
MSESMFDGAVSAPHRFDPEGATCGSGAQMTLSVEVVVNGSVDGENALITVIEADRPYVISGS